MNKKMAVVKKSNMENLIKVKPKCEASLQRKKVSLHRRVIVAMKVTLTTQVAPVVPVKPTLKVK